MDAERGLTKTDTLKTGGWFIGSDWLIVQDQTPSPKMATSVAEEGLDFGMANPDRYKDALQKTGFVLISGISRNLWYQEQARAELARRQGAEGIAAARIVGQDVVAKNIAVWSRMIPVLDLGEHCQTHLAARMPLSARHGKLKCSDPSNGPGDCH